MSLHAANQPAEPGSGLLLSVQNVVKDYSAQGAVVRALHGVSLDVAGGDFIALVGPSGCGKSTLLQLAGALDFPTSGHILLNGLSTTGRTDQELTQLRRAVVGFVFQSFQLLHTLSVIENVEVPLMLAGRPSPRPTALDRLAWVGVEELAHRQVHQLSGGQMQRVAIARALAHDPKVLLADEPTGNLDTATGTAILDLLRSIARERQVGIVMATHSSEAAEIADRVVRMRDGRIVSETRN